jgi:hypothetical protein
MPVRCESLPTRVPTMTESENELVAFRIGRRFDMKIVVATPTREWMNETRSGFANRCLPMRIASQAGWVILNDRSLRARWSGHVSADSVAIECAGSPPYAAISHFGEGILTFTIPFLFRTPPGLALLLRGPANLPKDAISPLEGLVETDWAVAAASVNWKFTRANTWVNFEQDEPICMIVPQRLDLLEGAQPRIVELDKSPELLQKYALWHESCCKFNERLRKNEPEAIRLGWQRFYFRGSAPHAECGVIPEAACHRTRLNLRSFIVDADIQANNPNKSSTEN